MSSIEKAVNTEEKAVNTDWFENAVRTKGGEALAGAASESWYMLWTHSNSEQLVHNQLAAKGFQLFLPTIEAWSRRGGVRRLARVPMFSGYVFLRHAVDKSSYIEICKAERPGTRSGGTVGSAGRDARC